MEISMEGPGILGPSLSFMLRHNEKFTSDDCTDPTEILILCIVS